MKRNGILLTFFSVLVSIDAQYLLKDQTLGCDGIIGSGRRFDKCGVCGGENKSCKIVSGIYTKKTSGAKYDYITDFPIGAININITEGKNTRNYLALRYTDSQEGIINANWSLDWSGQYNAAGTVVEYTKSRHHGIGENIFIQGPIQERLQLLLLSQTRNPGIYYEYGLPLDRGTVRSPYSSGLSAVGGSLLSNRYFGDSLGELYSPSINPKSRFMFNYLNVEKTADTINKMMSDKAQTNSVETSINTTDQLNNTLSDKVIDSQSSKPTSLAERLHQLVQNRQQNLAVDGAGYNILNGYQHVTTYQWKTLDTEGCSEPCGEGYRMTRVVCVSGTTQATVTDENCDKLTRPEERKIPCNTHPCVPDWEAGDWSECSATCGTSTQTRSVECRRRLSSTQTISVYAMNCDSSKKPSTVKMCPIKDCYNWEETEWTECSVKCGAGIRTRTVTCVDSSAQMVEEKMCSNLLLEKPRESEKCYSTCEEAWFYSEWRNTCSGGCGSGNRTRSVYCPADSPITLTQAESKCGEKPETIQLCEQTASCQYRGTWFAGEWSTCEGSCREAYQTRRVVCMTKRGSWDIVTYDDNCAADNKPIIKQKCRPTECDNEEAEWFITDWSKCSVTCGSGHQRREVKCLDSSLNEREDCKESSRPLTVKSCDQEECPVTETEQTTPRIDPSCKDKYTSCRVVVQARLCRIDYYKALCCLSCSTEH